MEARTDRPRSPLRSTTLRFAAASEATQRNGTISLSKSAPHAAVYGENRRMNSKFMGRGEIRLAGTADAESVRPILKLNSDGDGTGLLK